MASPPKAERAGCQVGAARGLLCSVCNTVLGKVEDDPQRLLRMIEYLGDGHA